MPQTIDERREYERQWRVRNREKIREYQIRNREKIREQRRAWRARNREYIRASHRADYALDPEKFRIRNIRARHGAGPELILELWQAQDGKCYLCGEDVDVDKAYVDHDHSCCPLNKSCPACRRGLAHPKCNTFIGYLGDDPERFRFMANALETAKAAAAGRIAETRQRQLMLPL
jgi:hypothetical protein